MVIETLSLLLLNDDWPLAGRDDLQSFAVHGDLKGIGRARYSMLTDKTNNRRADEMALAYDFAPAKIPGAQIGVFAVGNFGGGSVQNAWHSALLVPKVELGYESYDLRPIGIYSNEWQYGFIDAQYWLDGGRVVGGLQLTYQDGTIRIGASMHAGNQLSETAETWQSYGILFLEMRFNAAGKIPLILRLENGQAIGGVGFLF